MNLTPKQLAALRELALSLPKRRIKKKTDTGKPRPKPKPPRNPDDEAQWVVDLMQMTGGVTIVNLYRSRVGRRFVNALGYAVKRKMVREDRRTPPAHRAFRLTELGWQPRKVRNQAVKDFHRR